jgi:nucleotide-binding universal stress UspA family protein
MLAHPTGGCASPASRRSAWQVGGRPLAPTSRWVGEDADRPARSLPWVSVYQRILVATDGSATAAVAVDRAAELAWAVGASLTVASVGEEGAEGAQTVVDAEVERLTGTEATVAVDGLALEGDPATAIVAAAAEGSYDLVVLGNRGMTGARRTFSLGSVPNKVSHGLGCSLLIVRTTRE